MKYMELDGEVGICVSDSADIVYFPYIQVNFFPDLAFNGHFQGFTIFYFTSREFPQATQQASYWPSTDQKLLVTPNDSSGNCVMRQGWARPPYREICYLCLLESRAIF